ncbi:hypothetical protein DDD_3457 [Nonlabens dokdonensis DSW-6]|uniref:Uncharacterized protein n=2 Tax=Nonlabens dokdonensis TaxID=328515 RepID=L7WEM0_NONDD|nr:hypothetical protein DDD_3457 [Nonlabens dokdonensis DSW-6]
MTAEVEEMTKEISKRESFTLTLFKKHLVSLSLLRKAADEPALRMSQKHKDNIKSVTRTRYAELLKEDHQSIVDEATKQDINWKKIEFVDLLYKPRAFFKFGQPGYEGLWIFKDTSKKDVLFTMQVDFIILGTDAYILEIDDFKKQLK